jgi:hypothetical protein
MLPEAALGVLKRADGRLTEALIAALAELGGLAAADDSKYC